MAIELVTVAVVTNSAEAQFVVNLLAADGIEATIADDNIVTMDYLFGNAVGWIKVFVRELDADRAASILAAVRPPVTEDEIPWDQPPEEEGLDEEVTEAEIAQRTTERTAPIQIDPATAEMEQRALRIYRMAIIGLFLLPPIVNIYSLVLIYRTDPEESKRLSDASLRRSSLAFFINIFAILALGWAWIWFVPLILALVF